MTTENPGRRTEAPQNVIVFAALNCFKCWLSKYHTANAYCISAWQQYPLCLINIVKVNVRSLKLSLYLRYTFLCNFK